MMYFLSVGLMDAVTSTARHPSNTSVLQSLHPSKTTFFFCTAENSIRHMPSESSQIQLLRSANLITPQNAGKALFRVMVPG